MKVDATRTPLTLIYTFRTRLLIEGVVKFQQQTNDKLMGNADQLLDCFYRS